MSSPGAGLTTLGLEAGEPARCRVLVSMSDPTGAPLLASAPHEAGAVSETGAAALETAPLGQPRPRALASRPRASASRRGSRRSPEGGTGLVAHQTRKWLCRMGRLPVCDPAPGRTRPRGARLSGLVLPAGVWLRDPNPITDSPRGAPPGPHARAGWYLRRREPALRPERPARALGVRRKMASPGREAGSRPSIATGASPARPQFGCAPDIADSAGERESACGTRSRACSAGTARPDRGIWSSTRRAPTDGRPTRPQ
jgi:hypothetical protein